MEKIIVGKIINTHGIAGELKVQRTNEEAFDREISYYIDGYEEAFKIISSRIKGNLAYIKLEGYSNINDVEKFKARFIRVNEEDLYSLEEDKYFIKDLIGLEVYDQEVNYVGELIDVETYPANDVYVIASQNGNRLVPAVKEFIKRIDLDNNKIYINFIEGM